MSRSFLFSAQAKAGFICRRVNLGDLATISRITHGLPGVACAWPKTWLVTRHRLIRFKNKRNHLPCLRGTTGPRARRSHPVHFLFELAKVALTVVAAVRVTVHEPVPLQPPPLQPRKEKPEPGVAARVTTVPLG
jgi:hypothetical protein